MAARPRLQHPAAMTKRVIAALLWFYAGWSLGAMLAFVLGISPALGPILGAAGAMVIAGDPRHIIWRTPTA
ncbi:MAG TPA: hypothetical protein VF763_07945 [Candidatus Limnocylindrales bacterium]